MMGRYFMAIDLNPQAKDSVQEVTAPLKGQFPRTKWVGRDNYHITLVFLGERDGSYLAKLTQVAGRLAAEQAPFSLDLQGWGFFPNSRRVRVMYIGTSQGAGFVSALAKSLLHWVGQGETAFHPHLTVARFRQPISIQAPVDFPPIALDVQELTLFSSTLTSAGPVYRTVDKFSLTGLARGE